MRAGEDLHLEGFSGDAPHQAKPHPIFIQSEGATFFIDSGFDGF